MEGERVVGWGDELIVTGQARVLNAENGHKVVVRDRHGRIRAHEIWANNPRIAGPYQNLYKPNELVNAPGLRPYIAAKSPQQWVWRDFAPPVGEIYFSEAEIAFARGHAPAVVIEPNNKAKASPNKDWGLARWVALAARLRAAGIVPVQLGPAGTRVIEHASIIHTPSFRHACAVLARARAAVLPEGGLHHAAAAVGVPSVVIYGGFISPRQTGYALHTNLFTGGKPCGLRIPCPHCEKAMAEITPEAVFAEVQKLLENRA